MKRIYTTLSLRPQFHFSQKVGWNNDPNGMVYWDGEWHLFFQHNPVGVRWGNMTWGHAVSPDLIHWEQLPDALFPETMARGACFSGSAVVDHKNTTGWGRDGRPALVAILTDTGSGESLAYSLDNGRRFTWYENNPVVQHRGRDPKVIWYRYRDGDTALNSQAERLGGHWVMAVYDEHPEYGRNIAFYTSTDLKDWTEQSHLPGYFECPELFELPVAGEPSQRRWVVYAADAQYAIGRFDGRKFVPEHSGKQRLHYGQYYASQLFNDAPGERRIQIGWAKIEMPGMPFNQTFSFPHELSLERTENGLRLLANPIEEIRILRTQAWTRENCRLNPGEPVALEVTGELFDIRAEWKVGDAGGVVLDLGGDRIRYDVRSAKLDEAPLPAEGGRVVIRVLVDRPMLEINGNDGAVVITRARHGRGPIQQIRVLAEGATAHLIRLEVCGLRSIWKK
ncbi:MAG: 2,6-beta-D-fructofuranosidase [Pirellulaceae bacterium]|nr:MAG: 2,6-beta-D-fructofuranosidase [Pirellulaceae bacterium]